nr:hypothetical protein [Phocaeicola vulgatus]
MKRTSQNALTGKVSGVQIIRSSNGPGGSSKIQLRGANSVTGLNQPVNCCRWCANG